MAKDRTRNFKAECQAQGGKRIAELETEFAAALEATAPGAIHTAWASTYSGNRKIMGQHLNIALPLEAYNAGTEHKPWLPGEVKAALVAVVEAFYCTPKKVHRTRAFTNGVSNRPACIGVGHELGNDQIAGNRLSDVNQHT